MRVISVILILLSFGIIYVLIGSYLNVLIDEKYEVEIMDVSRIKSYLGILIVYVLIVISYIIYILTRLGNMKKAIKEKGI